MGLGLVKGVVRRMGLEDGEQVFEMMRRKKYRANGQETWTPRALSDGMKRYRKEEDNEKIKTTINNRSSD